MNLIFPIAGKGERFGGVFKPFLKIGEITFIERTIESFANLDQHNIFFICTQEQSIKYNVKNELTSLFNGLLRFELIVIPIQTSGPLETIREALKISNISGPSIVCDCDHYLDARSIVEHTESGEFDIIIPIYNIEIKDFNNWSKIIFKNNKILRIVEKEIIDTKDFKGIIGGIGFKNIENILDDNTKNMIYISEYLNYMSQSNQTIKCIPIDSCLFYGDKNKHSESLEKLRSQATIFCDIDGILFNHNDVGGYDLSKLVLIDGYEKLFDLKQNGHKIILSTARPEKDRQKLVELLDKSRIAYNDIIMGCRSGHRILINDRKPSKPFQPQAISFELPRDIGLKTFNIDDHSKQFSVKIIDYFQGNGVAKIYLIEKDNERLVRKSIIKTKDNHRHYLKLKRQFSDLKRFSFLNEYLVPKTIEEVDSSFEYFYDMQYLSGFRNLSYFPEKDQVKVLKSLLAIMEKDVYCLRKKINSKIWLENFINSVIKFKLMDYCKIDKNFNTIINEDIEINGKKYLALNKILEKINLNKMYPKYISPIHGDLSLENIMFDGEHYKLIDMDGSELFDFPEHDLGKICQSILSQYSVWSQLANPILSINGNSFECVDNFFDLPKDNVFNSISSDWEIVLQKENILSNAIFYMCLYFIRFVPFRMNISNEHGYFSLLMCTVWMNKIIED